METANKETGVDWPINVGEPKLATMRLGAPFPVRSPTAIPRGLVPAGKEIAVSGRPVQAFKGEDERDNIKMTPQNNAFRFIGRLP